MSGALAQLDLHHEFATQLSELAVPWQAETFPAPRTLIVNEPLAQSLAVDVEFLYSDEGAQFLAGAALPAGAHPVAQAYSGHQFGQYSPRLGDGRALLLGELPVPGTEQLVDLHLKGSGRTPFARGGDGRAAIGPMLREYLISEAMHALGVPTTRSLAVLATGDMVQREKPLPGAVLARVAASHLRVGTFQAVAAAGNTDLLTRLVDFAIDRHDPQARKAERPALALFDGVIHKQAQLVAQWMHVGFVHGVMNTDNTTISGETIDYGPCAFMDVYDPHTAFSSIDVQGRYAYGRQPAIMQWNLARFAEALVPVIDDSADTAVELLTAALRRFGEAFQAADLRGMAKKLGITTDTTGSDGNSESRRLAELVAELRELMAAARVDYTQFFAHLARQPEVAVEMLGPNAAAWQRSWQACGPVATVMQHHNPLYIPRNHHVEAALEAATDGDLTLFTELLDVVTKPYEPQQGREEFAAPPPAGTPDYVTYCGT